MTNPGIHKGRASTLLASPHVASRKPPRDVPWPVAHPAPPDLSELYLVCDGLALDDGLVLLGQGELADVTQWLVLDKGLSWPDDLVVVGERRDMIVVLDLDVRGERAGGGVLEVGSDDLGAFERVASDVVSYALVRSGSGSDLAPPPEMAARKALEAGDAPALEAELARHFYPGHHRLLSTLALELGALWARAGDAPRAMAAFQKGVDARLRGVGRGAVAAEQKVVWQAAAHAARGARAADIAAECERRAGLS